MPFGERQARWVAGHQLLAVRPGVERAQEGQSPEHRRSAVRQTIWARRPVMATFHQRKEGEWDRLDARAHRDPRRRGGIHQRRIHYDPSEHSEGNRDSSQRHPVGPRMTEERARAIIAPWYRLFNVPGRGDVRTAALQVLTSDYQSCAGDQPGECQGREAEIKLVESFARTIPDMRWQIDEVLVAGDRVSYGTADRHAAGELFGVPHTGKSFRMMAVDIHTIRDGRSPRRFTWRIGAAPLRSCAAEDDRWPRGCSVPVANLDAASRLRTAR